MTMSIEFDYIGADKRPRAKRGEIKGLPLTERKEWVRQQQLKSNRNLSAARALIGLCRQCKEPKMNEFARLATNALGAANCVVNGVAVMHLLESQNYLCPYSGALLVPGKNAAIDHIMPKSRFPDLAHSLSNLQWLDRRINFMKGDLLPEEFLSICKLLVGRADGEQISYKGSQVNYWGRKKGSN